MQLEAKIRDIKGKKVKSLREQGLIPAVLYGWGEKESRMLSVDEKNFRKVWHEAGESTLIDLEIGDKKKSVLIHDVAVNPIKDNPIHVDFYAVQMDKMVQIAIPLIFVGESPAVKNLGGTLVKVMHEIEVEALPKDIPSEIEINIEEIKTFEDHITVAHLKLGDKVKSIPSSEEVIALVEPPRKEEEEDKEERTIDDVKVEDRGKKDETTDSALKEEKDKIKDEKS